MAEILEPSHQDLGDAPDTVRRYVDDLEEEIDRLSGKLKTLLAKIGNDLFPDSVAEPYLVDWIAELERELGMRRGLYPKWVEGGKMTQAVADRRIATLESLLAVLKERRG